MIISYVSGSGNISKSVSSPQASNGLTKTGETFEERAAYHRRGQLSPGERAMAAEIRSRLDSKQDNT